MYGAKCFKVTQIANSGNGLNESIQRAQNSMTNDPAKVWPNGIVPYKIDVSVGKCITTHSPYTCLSIPI